MVPSGQVANAAADQRTKKCRYCHEEIFAAAQKCKHCGEFLSPAARRAAGLKPANTNLQAADVKIPIGQSLLCILICLPLGIVALIFAAQADAKLKNGDIAGAATAAATARNIAVAGFLIGVILIALMLAAGK